MIISMLPSSALHEAFFQYVNRQRSFLLHCSPFLLYVGLFFHYFSFTHHFYVAVNMIISIRVKYLVTTDVGHFYKKIEYQIKGAVNMLDTLKLSI